jgi:hypothetical protein
MDIISHTHTDKWDIIFLHMYNKKPVLTFGYPEQPAKSWC